MVFFSFRIRSYCNSGVNINKRKLQLEKKKSLGFPGGPVGKNLPASAGDIREVGSIPGSGRSPAGRNPLQHSCLENPMDRGAWRATIHGVTKTWTRTKVT